MNHDHSYKLLFSHAELVADLIRGFVREDWVAQLDFSTLARVDVSHVSDRLRGRSDDLIWRVRWGTQWLFIYLLLEFQSTVNTYMAVRIQTYEGLLYEDLIRAKQIPPSGRLPPVLPLVLYNGDAPWTAAVDVADLIEPPPGDLARYTPRLRYLLLDIGRLREADLPAGRNLAAAVVRLEHSREPAAMQQVVRTLIDWLREPAQDRLRRAFAVWLRRVLLPARLPGVELMEVHDLLEVDAMLATRVMEWTQRWKQEGIEEEHRRRLLAERALLVRLTRNRFGDACAQKLEPLLETIDDPDRLADIGEWIVEYNSGDELLTRIQRT